MTVAPPGPAITPERQSFEIKYDPDGAISKIISYFPFSESEKQEIASILGGDVIFDGFHSIFADAVNDEDWNRTKDQIKRRSKTSCLTLITPDQIPLF